MEQRILVTYATKYGATAEIAEKIGQVLCEAGLFVDVLPTDGVTNVTAYEAIVLGSGVYAGQWLKDAVTFLESNEQTLTTHPTWLFSSGPTGIGDPAELMKGWRFPKAQQPIADRIHPRDIAFFHGNMNMQKLNLVEKLLVRGIKAPIGDFRDWAAITTWANTIAETIKHELPQPLSIAVQPSL